MLINSRGSAFDLNFPKGFFPAEVIEWADPYIKRKPIAYQNFEAYMSSSVQSVTFPSISMEPVEQQAFGKTRAYKNARWTGDMYSNNISISMKLFDGYFNYFCWQRTLHVWHQLYAVNETYFPPLKIRTLDEQGYVTQAIQFSKLTITDLSEITLDYTSNQPEFKSFTVGFRYNLIEFMTETD